MLFFTSRVSNPKNNLPSTNTYIIGFLTGEIDIFKNEKLSKKYIYRGLVNKWTR